VFHQAGHTEIAAIEDAYHLLEPLLGERLAPVLFAIALIAAGQSSTITGTLAGQIVMEGFLDLRISPWLRRLITRALAVVPALLVIGIMGDEMVNELLIFSQVALSLQLGFALVPLIHSVSNRAQMKEFTIQWYWQLLSWIAASVIVLLNLWLVWQTLHDWHKQQTVSDTLLNLVLYPVFLSAVALLLFIVLYPMIKRRDIQGEVHQEVSLSGLAAKPFRRIGVCLDFSVSDERAIAHALGLKSDGVSFFLIHVVESPLARRTGRLVSDKETRADEKRLQQAADHFRKYSFDTQELLSFGDPKTSIPQLAKDHQLDLLVLAGHGHQGLGDMVYGQTANTVRHRAGIPVLIV
jgi:manganese transport protein